MDNAEQSLCWHCQYGVCLRETETEKILHPELENNEDFSVMGTIPENNIIEHTLNHERIKAICFWKPEHVESSPPILVGFVHQCNRFLKT